jgi:hypothetical protein
LENFGEREIVQRAKKVIAASFKKEHVTTPHVIVIHVPAPQAGGERIKPFYTSQYGQQPSGGEQG